jgi:hypothetical protein
MDIHCNALFRSPSKFLCFKISQLQKISLVGESQKWEIPDLFWGIQGYKA